MRFIYLSFFALLFTLGVRAQVDLPPAKVKAIKQKIENEIPFLKLKLKKDEADTASITFAIDTFRIERFFEEHLDLVSTDSEMADVGYEQAKSYDLLLNKYYKRLMEVLKEDDKKTLVQTQRAWIVFRDSELKLHDAVEKPVYGGGGTILILNDSMFYLDLLKTRALAMFDYYLRASGIGIH